MHGLKWSLLVAVGLAFSAQAADKKIERTFNSKCGSCHGKDGKGQTEKGLKMKLTDMTTAEFQKKSDDDFKKAINDGIKVEKDGIKKEMDPFKDELKPDEVDGMVKYIRELKK